jgi:hypothetical protein
MELINFLKIFVKNNESDYFCVNWKTYKGKIRKKTERLISLKEK